MFQTPFLVALLGSWIVAVDALRILQPVAGENVSLADPFVITWQVQTGDASAISIDLLNSSALNPNPILENIAHNLNTSAGSVNVTWPETVPNDTAAYTLYFIATASGDTVASSGIFNLTLPAGESRSQAEGTVGPYGTHPSTDYPTTATSHKLHAGAIAGIVVGTIAFIAFCAVCVFLHLRRRRRRQRRSTEDEKHDKPELDTFTSAAIGHKRGKTIDTFTSTELDADEEKKRIGSQEMEGDDTKDYLRYELPTTPPPPAELPDTDIPASEMPSPDPNEEKDPQRLGDWPLRDMRAPTPVRPESMRSGRTGTISIGSGTTTLGGRELSFAEALHEIVSQELRRKG